MAISYVGGTSGTGTGSSYNVSLSGTLTGGSDSSPSAGDVIVVMAANGNTASVAPTVSGNTSGAYIGAGAASHANDTWDTEFRTFYQVAGSTPDTTLTITRANNTTYGGGTVVMVFRGVDTTTPLDATGTPATGTNGSRFNPPSITPTTSGAYLIYGGAGTQAAASGVAPTDSNTSTYHVAVKGDGSTADIGVGMGAKAWTSGAFDAAANTNLATSTSSSWAAQAIALKPQPNLAPTVTADNESGTASTNTYYFNASVSGPTDSGAVWTNDANAFDGSTGTTATTGTTGGQSTNYLRGDGTTAPGSGDPIVAVRGRVHNGTTWGAYVDLAIPTGGWDYTKLQNLEANAWLVVGTTYSLQFRIGSFGQILGTVANYANGLARAEIEVTTKSTSDTTPDLTFTGTDANSDDIRYNVQLDTSSTFDGTLIDSAEDTVTSAGTLVYAYDADNSAIGQTFTGDGNYINSVEMMVFKQGSPTGNCYVRIYAHSGTYGDSGIPTGSILAESDAVSASTIVNTSSSGTAYQKFTFSGSNLYKTTATTKYVAVLYYVSGTISNAIGVKFPDNNHHSGNGVHYYFGWVYTYQYDIKGFKVNTSLLDEISGTDAGFSGTPDNTDPFTSGQAVTYTVQSALSSGTYYWRARGIDPSGSNTYGSWSSIRAFTVASGTPQYTKTHTSDALKRAQTTKTHTTSSYLRAKQTLTVTHTTNSLKRLQTTKAHTTDALKKLRTTKTHTTDSFKRGQYTKVHTSDALKRLQTTRTHTTDSYLRVGAVTYTRTHTTDSLRRSQNTRSHTTDSFKRLQVTKTHTTDALKRLQTTKTHTTNALKRLQTTKTHTTDAVKRLNTTRTHTTNALKRLQTTVSHTTSSVKRLQVVKTHTTNSVLRLQTTKSHTTNSLLRKANTVSHTTSSYTRGSNSAQHTTDSLKRATSTRTHTTDAVKARGKYHTTDSLLDSKRRYWVGGTGGTFGTGHWSYTSGGASGAPEPDETVTAVFDANSFSANGQTVTFEGLNAKYLDASAVTYSVNFVLDSNLLLQTGFVLCSNISFNGAYSAIDIDPWDNAGSTVTIDQNSATMYDIFVNCYGYYGAQTFELLSPLRLDALNGSNQFTGDGGLYTFGYNNAIFETNDFDIDVTELVFGNFTVNLGTSTLRFGWYDTRTGAGALELILNSSSATYKVYYSTYFSRYTFLVRIEHTLQALYVNGTGYFHTLLGNRTITTQDFTADPGATVYAYSSSPYTLTIAATNFYISGTVSNQVYLGFTGTNYRNVILSKASGTVTGNYITAQNNTVQGGATWIAGTGFVDSGSVIGWVRTYTKTHSTDAYLDSGIRYWVGGTGDWDSTSSWSYTSGGSSGASVPTATNDVIFDANSFSVNNSVVTLPSLGATIKSLDATAVDQTATIKASTGHGYITVKGSLVVHPSGYITFGASTTNDVEISIEPTTTGTYSFGLGAAVHYVAYINIAPASTGSTINQTSPIYTADNSYFNIQEVTYNTNNYQIEISEFYVAGMAGTTVNLGTSTIYTQTFSVSSGSSFSGASSTIRIKRLHSWSTASGPGLFNYLSSATFGTVIFEHTAYGYLKDITGDQIIVAQDTTVNIYGNVTSYTTVNDIYFEEGSTIEVDAGDTIRSDNWWFYGVSGNEVTIRTWSDGPGTYYFENPTFGTTTADYLNIKNNTVSDAPGFDRWIAGTGFIDSGNVIGWVRTYTKTHTSDSYLRPIQTLTVSGTTDSFLRKRVDTTHTTNAVLRKTNTVNHSTDSRIRDNNVIQTRTHTTSSVKRAQNTVSHTTDAQKRIRSTVSHSSDSLLRKTYTVTHSTSANKKKTTDVSHTTDSLKRAQNTVQHTTSSLKRKQTVVTHATNSLLRVRTTVSHTTNSNRFFGRQHSTSAVKQRKEPLSRIMYDEEGNIYYRIGSRIVKKIN